MKQITKINPDPGAQSYDVVNMTQDDVYIHRSIPTYEIKGYRIRNNDGDYYLPTLYRFENPMIVANGMVLIRDKSIFKNMNTGQLDYNYIPNTTPWKELNQNSPQSYTLIRKSDDSPLGVREGDKIMMIYNADTVGTISDRNGHWFYFNWGDEYTSNDFSWTGNNSLNIRFSDLMLESESDYTRLSNIVFGSPSEGMKIGYERVESEGIIEFILMDSVAYIAK